MLWYEEGRDQYEFFVRSSRYGGNASRADYKPWWNILDFKTYFNLQEALLNSFVKLTQSYRC